jgi:hypothetical protein
LVIGHASFNTQKSTFFYSTFYCHNAPKSINLEQLSSIGCYWFRIPLTPTFITDICRIQAEILDLIVSFFIVLDIKEREDSSKINEILYLF